MSYFWTSDNLQDCSGIYVIFFGESNECEKVCVGSATNLRKRFNSHKSALLRNKSNCIKLQRFFNKYFEDFCMNFLVLEYCPVSELKNREAHHIKGLGALGECGLNIARDTTAPMLGRKHSTATKELMALKSKGNKSNLGRVFSIEHRAKLGALASIRNKGRKMSEEFCRHNSEIHMGINNGVSKSFEVSDGSRSIIILSVRALITIGITHAMYYSTIKHTLRHKNFILTPIVKEKIK